MQPRTLIIGLAMATMAGCANSHNDPETVTVELQDYQFHPQEIEINAGDTVRWVNEDKRASHDVYFPEEGIKSERFFGGESFEHTFEEPGTYEYHCQPHENRDMRGVVIVK